MQQSKFKFFIVIVSMLIAGSSIFLAAGYKETEADILGKEQFKQSVYIDAESNKELYNITSEYVTAYENAHGNKQEIEKATKKRAESESAYYERLYYKNIEKFREYQQKVDKLVDNKQLNIEKDKNLFREYMLFNTHVQNKRFIQAADSLGSIESQLNIKIRD